MAIRRAILVGVLAALNAAPAVARSKAATYLIEEHIANACGPSGGTIDDSAAIERDLTGDGKADFVLSHEGIKCADGGRSSFCGMQVCGVHIYVRRGGLLVQEVEMLGGGVKLVGDGIPAIEMFAHGGTVHRIRWNGTTFK